MTIENAIHAAALKMAKKKDIDQFHIILLAMTEGARLMQIDLLANKAQTVCKGCGACQEGE